MAVLTPENQQVIDFLICTGQSNWNTDSAVRLFAASGSAPRLCGGSLLREMQLPSVFSAVVSANLHNTVESAVSSELPVPSLFERANDFVPFHRFSFLGGMRTLSGGTVMTDAGGQINAQVKRIKGKRQ